MRAAQERAREDCQPSVSVRERWMICFCHRGICDPEVSGRLDGRCHKLRKIQVTGVLFNFGACVTGIWMPRLPLPHGSDPPADLPKNKHAF